MSLTPDILKEHYLAVSYLAVEDSGFESVKKSIKTNQRNCYYQSNRATKSCKTFLMSLDTHFQQNSCIPHISSLLSKVAKTASLFLAQKQKED